MSNLTTFGDNRFSPSRKANVANTGYTYNSFFIHTNPRTAPGLPSSFASQVIFSNYYLSLVDDYDPVKTGMTAGENAEMAAALLLVKRGSVTKLFAVDSGTWNNAANWYPNGVPGANANVCIPEGTVCTYDLNDSTTKLFTVRVDGTFQADPTIDCAILFDTMVITPLGTRRSGTLASPVPADKTHQYIIATSNGEIDVGPHAWDTFFQSRGIISIGLSDDHGYKKNGYFEAVSPAVPVAGATSLQLNAVPTGWLVGDSIVICSTVGFRYFSLGGASYTGTAFPDFQDEERTITSITGSTISWTGGLTWSHIGPTGVTNRQDCKCYVINLTRNIVFRPDNASADLNHRGHTMQMHNYNGWKARGAEFRSLGRTSKLGGSTKGIIARGWGTLAAGVSMDLTASPHWDVTKSAIYIGTSFNVTWGLVAPDQTIPMYITIVGKDELGAPLTDIITIQTFAGFSTRENRVLKYFLTVTSISFSQTYTAATFPFMFISNTGRQMNEKGLRDLRTAAGADTVYTDVTTHSNVQSRYPFHWHKLGVVGNILLNAPYLDSCSIHDSPGWLVAQHQTHANIRNCVGYKAHGSGFVSEDGNETGVWLNNISVNHFGDGDTTFKAGPPVRNLDTAVQGVAFWATSRIMRLVNNIAGSCLGGFVFETRFASPTSHELLFDQAMSCQTCFRGNVGPGSSVSAMDAQWTIIEGFSGNIGFALSDGFLVSKSNNAHNHALTTVLKNYKAWSTSGSGINITYTSHYNMNDIDCFAGRQMDDYAGTSYSSRASAYGIFQGTNSTGMRWIRFTSEGYSSGFAPGHDSTSGDPATFSESNNIVIVDAVFRDCGVNYYDGSPGQPAIKILPYDIVVSSSSLSQITATLTNPVMTVDVPGQRYGVQGTLTDTFSTYYLSGPIESFSYGIFGSETVERYLQRDGYWVDVSDGKPYLLADEWFSDRLTGINDKIKIPINVSSSDTYIPSMSPYTNNGSCDLSNHTKPVFNDFTVIITQNENRIVDIIGRATGSHVKYGLCKQPLKSTIVDNKNGTITIVPFPNETYTETTEIWVDDNNGNTTRATMTIIFGQRLTLHVV
jgi:hypothetical protein